MNVRWRAGDMSGRGEWGWGWFVGGVLRRVGWWVYLRKGAECLFIFVCLFACF